MIPRCRALRSFVRSAWNGALVFLLGSFAAGLSAGDSSKESAAAPLTGPATEQRFPPLTVPEGFRATLFACDPLVEYPSVIALGPQTGSLFVAHDYLTGLGVEIVRRDEIRWLLDTDQDGYADRSVLYADGFYSIQGLAYHAGVVYAMHAPLLTALRDVDGDGVADERRDLLTGLGLPPEKNPSRLHCANGVTVGHDGWLYLALGDNGVDVTRPEGDQLVLHAGGILRCRPTGRDLHLFSTGLRNIYDVALDDRLNVFVRDNENDGGDYMIRICHSFPGADHGYPYLYREFPLEALSPLADLGRGSSAGGACYLETAFPPSMRGHLFFCEWGRAVVMAPRQPAGAGFARTSETDFASGAPSDPYGFKPTDLVVDRDGSLLISDWCDGQRPKRGRGRIYRVHYVGEADAPRVLPRENATELRGWLKQLGAPEYSRRIEAQTELERLGSAGLAGVREALREKTLNDAGRMHAVWLLVALAGRDSLAELWSLAESDASPSVRAQGVRGIADLTDPRFVSHRLEAGPADPALAERLAALPGGIDPEVYLEIVTAMGRWQWSGVPAWLQRTLTQKSELDGATAHALQQTLRRCGNWPGVLTLLDEPSASPLRTIALRALAEQAEPVVVDGLIERLQHEADPLRRRQYAELLVRVYQKPGPWTYWGYRPAPRPAHTVPWKKTERIGQTLNRALADPDFDLRAAVLRKMQREAAPVSLEGLERWLQSDTDVDRVAVILDSLGKSTDPQATALLERALTDRRYAPANRLEAWRHWSSRIDDQQEARLLSLARDVDEGVVLERLLAALSRRPGIDSRELLLLKLDSKLPEIRAAALDALVWLQIRQAVARVPALLDDPGPDVRRAAALAAGVFSVTTVTEKLRELTRDNDPATRGAALDSLRRLGVAGAQPEAVAALEHPESQAGAIDYLGRFGGPEHAALLVAAILRTRTSPMLTQAARALATWEERLPADSSQASPLRLELARLHGESGTLAVWRVREGNSASDLEAVREGVLKPDQELPSVSAIEWQSRVADGVDHEISLPPPGIGDAEVVWLACADVHVSESTGAQFLASCTGTMEVWLNGRSIHRREKSGTFQPDAERFESTLDQGRNRLVIQLVSAQRPARFHLRFRRRGSSAEHERLAQYALQSTGQADRGRELFFNAEKTLCVKCHRLGDQGGRIGPDLTGVGSRFARMHLIESILEPGRTIAPSYETLTVELSSGRVVSGVRVSETETHLTLGDDQGKLHEISQSDVEHRAALTRSNMPDGLEKRLTDAEFVDLVTFLISQKKSDAR
ncbi:MAG: HEAT repeat domain-containing protein [Planctomycetales bacterium]